MASVRLNRNKAVRLAVPDGTSSGEEARAIVLVDNARYNVLGGLVKRCELLDSVFDYLLCPLVDLLSLVGRVRRNDTLDNVLEELCDLGGAEVLVVIEICHLLYNYLNLSKI